MVPRERVIAAIEHKNPDRLPVDLGGSIVTGINSMAYRRLKSYLGFGAGPSRVTNIILLLSEVEQELLDLWQLDVLPLNRLDAAPGVPLTGGWKNHALPDGNPALFPAAFSPKIGKDGSWELFDGDRVISRLNSGSGSFVPTYFPLKGADLAALEAFELPVISDRELDYLHSKAKELYENTDYAIFGWFDGSIFERSQFLCSWEGFMLRLGADLEFVNKLLTKLTSRIIADLELYLDAVGDYIQVIGFGDDFGIQSGPQLAPRQFREVVKPFLKNLYSTAHRLSKARVFLHSCGSVYEFIEDFIEIGVDILNPVQTSALNMEPERLKREFGSRITFWGGGVDVQHILPKATPEQVRRNVRFHIEALNHNGGYIFAPVHNIQADVPVENIAAMYEESLRFRCL